MRRRVTLGELTGKSGVQTGPFGSQLHAHEYTANGVPVVMPQDIGDNVIRTDSIARVPDDVAHRLARHRLQPGDIVYSRRGDVERRALVRREQDGWLCGTGCLRVRLDRAADADPRFLSYCLGAPAIRSWIVSHAVGGTMLNLNTGILSAVPLELPTMRQQQAIADVLGALDDKIAANKRTASAAVDLAGARFIRLLPAAESRPTTYEAVADIAGGGTPSTRIPDYWDGGIPWVTPTDVTALPGPYLDSTQRTITWEGLGACSSALHPAGSILMTSRATIGAFALAKVPAAVNQGFIVVNAKGPQHQWWLFHEMQTRVGDYVAHANGATFLELSRGRFRTMPLAWPSNEVVFERFAALVEPLHGRAYQALTESRALARLRDTLLPHLMSGRISVRDAEAVVSDAV